MIAHYTTCDYRVETRLLALRRFYGDHSGENQAELLTKIIKDFDFADRLEYLVTDNATNNDTCVDVLLQKFLPNLTPTQRERRRLRC
jgi:hypothetical protein